MTRRKDFLRAAACSLFIAALAAGAPASAQTAPDPSTLKPDGNAVAMQQKWDGIWDTVGGMVFDPKYAVPGKIPEEVREYPPYNPEWEARYAAIVAEHAAGIGNDPLAHCGPHGMPRILGGGPGPIEIIVKPGVVYLIWEYMNQVRRVYTDGRGHPAADDLYPMHFGHSIGRWEGDTLVVDTISMMDAQPFDRTGAPHSDQVKTVERIRMAGPNMLEDRVTVTDPVAFTKPWEVVRQWKRAPSDYAMQDVYCDLQRNPLSDGNTKTILPGEPGYEEATGKLPK